LLIFQNCGQHGFCIPAVSHSFKTVDVTFRSFGEKPRDRQYGFHGSKGIVWCFYYLLEQFLFYGPMPGSPSDSGKRNRPIAVHNINMDFSSGGNDSRISEEIPTELIQQDPKWLVSYVQKEIEGIMDMGYHTAPYGGFIYERVGTFEFKINGRITSDIDVGDMLAKLEKRPDEEGGWNTASTFGDLPRDCRLLTFWIWKFRTLRTRKRLGLDIPKTCIWPTLEDMEVWRRGGEIYKKQQKNEGHASFCKMKHCFCYDHRLEDQLFRLVKRESKTGREG